jgi:tRNA threonylcarbamoyladenosine biosynthesis protein TsaE
VESDRNHTITISTSSPEQTQAAGRVLGAYASAGDVFLLTGELGAGKTCLTQGILWGLGGEEYARSPTFVLICEYYARLTLYHMDLYRVDSIDEVINLGIDDYFLGEGVCVVEWAEKGADVFIGEHVNVVIEDTGDNSRRLTFGADSLRYSEMLCALKREFSNPDSVFQSDASKSQTANNEAQ